jgi:hydrogenase large subunit
MRSLNPLEGEFYREALQVSRSTREMFCLMEGRHVPLDALPGRRRHDGDRAASSDYLTRLMPVRRVHEAGRPYATTCSTSSMPRCQGYEEVGRRRADLGSAGEPERSRALRLRYDHMTDWGGKMFVSPGVIRNGELITNDQESRST